MCILLCFPAGLAVWWCTCAQWFPFDNVYIVVFSCRIGRLTMVHLHHRTYVNSGSTCWRRASVRLPVAAWLCTVWPDWAGESQNWGIEPIHALKPGSHCHNYLHLHTGRRQDCHVKLWICVQTVPPPYCHQRRSTIKSRIPSKPIGNVSEDFLSKYGSASPWSRRVRSVTRLEGITTQRACNVIRLIHNIRNVHYTLGTVCCPTKHTVMWYTCRNADYFQRKFEKSI